MALASEIIGSIVGSGSSLLNAGFNALSLGAQTRASKELMDYQWKNFSSPQAQVRAMGEAGLNAGALLGNGKGGFAAPSPAMPSSVPAQIDGVASMANYLTAVANAKKAGVDTKNVEVETQQRQFEFELSKVWSNPEKIVNLTSAWKNVMLQNDQHNLNEWKKESEKALSQLKGIERDTAQKILDNMDTQISQENWKREEDIKLTQERQKTEQTAQTANVASAKASNAQASLSQHQQTLIDYQSEFQNMVNQVKRSNLSSETLTELKKILANRALSDAEQKEAQLRMQHVEAFINARNMSAAWREFDNACNWISSKISASISGSFSSSSVSKD